MDLAPPGRLPGAAARSERWARAEPALVVIGSAAIAAATVAAGRHQSAPRSVDAVGVALVAAAILPLIARRRAPLAVLGAAFAATLAYVLAGYPGGPLWLGLIAAYLNAVMSGHRRIAWGTMATGYVAFVWVAAFVRDGSGPSLGFATGIAAWMAVLVAAGELLRGGRDRRLAAAQARREELRRQAGEERMRIARELHDVLAHTISLINVQASVGLHLIDRRPEQAREALEAISRASKDALAEVRSVLGVLRPGDEAAPRLPAPGLARLDELVTQAREAGLAVQARVTGEAGTLEPAADAAAFRIVQEALTNVRRHAGASCATVTLDYSADALTVSVDDDGRGCDGGAPPAAGLGIRGMRGRAEALGGRLEAGAGPGGGFRVRARLPREPGR